MAAELQRRLEDARTEGNRLEAIINSMSGAVLALDKNLNLLFVNPPARRLFKLEHRTIRGLSLLEAVRSAELDWAARKVLSGEKPEETELRLCEGASVRRFHVFTAPLPSPPGGGSPGAVMVLEDLTRLVRLEQIRRDFVANVSHELRTPVQLIKGFAETLLDDGTGPDQIRRGAGIILKNALTMENLINDLLSLAGLEDEGRGRPGPEDLALAPLFDEALASVGPRADKKGISFTVECPAELRAPVYGSFVVQALINLLDNAVKYSPASSRIRAAARREGEDLVLEVRDEGIGIAAEHLERIFERFYRVDRSRGREEGSTGLGLSIVRHIALLHGGRTEVESHAGEGSVFRVRIPAG
ncbi:MAG: PAS domain-containing protein [Treponema sp.]|nr:PAS domain-containing protein [Treponema sp.]